MVLESADEYSAYVTRSDIHLDNWFDKGRALLTDGSVVQSEKDNGPSRVEHIGALAAPLLTPAEPQSPQSPTRDP